MTFKNLIKKIVLELLFSFYLVTYSFAQLPVATNAGMDFYVAFGKNNEISTILGDGSDNDVQLLLRIVSLEETQVTLSFTENASLNTTFSVLPEVPKDYILTLDQARASYTTPAIADKKSIHVTATNPITLFAMNVTKMNMDATLVWPVESYGTEYYNIGIPPYTMSGAVNCNGYIIIAKENGTTVTQTNIPVSGTIITTLDAGEVYHYNSPNTDAIRAHITSDKPIAFFQSGTKSTLTVNGALTNNVRNSYTYEQFLPTNSWGTRFILPTNETDAAYARIYAKEATNLTVRYSNNSEETFSVSANNYQDIMINGYNNHSASNSAYILTNKPVGIATFNVPRTSDQVAQPAEMWLPPLEQTVHNILVSPLDVNVKLVYSYVKHYFTIIVPTVGKEQTTISLNGSSVQYIQDLPNFTWEADNIGGSGYSFGRYYFGESFNNTSYPSNPIPSAFLNTTAMVDNPNGIIAMAWGQGSYADYAYTVGSAYRDLTASFTVNGVGYTEMDGKAYCDTKDFKFIASPDLLTNIVWTLNGEEIPASRNQLTVNVTNLPDGYYTVNMFANNADHVTHFWVGGSSVVWTPEANTSGTDAEKQDWNNMANWTPAVVPSTCHNVYIPGNSQFYPVLTTKTNAACNNIYFMQGAELGYPNLLNYQKAHVQYNFGLLVTPQITDQNSKNLVLYSSDTDDRMLYSAAVSSPIDRERWYMLSSPLLGAVSGDFCFGGFPLTFMMKFGPIAKDNINYPVGNWTTPYTSTVERLSPTEGFAFYMYGKNRSDNTGCAESGFFSDLDDASYMPDVNARISQTYGIKDVNGILELPFFEDAVSMDAHRTQIYNSPTRESTFYDTNDGIQNPADFNKIVGSSTSTTREDHNGNYRFIPETYSPSSGTWNFQNPINHSVAGLSMGDEFMVGNPYMSSIDMVEFCRLNPSVNPSFRIWNGEEFIDFRVNIGAGTVTPTAPVDMRYVAPLQGFFLTYVGKGDVVFDVTQISTVRPSNTSFNLRSAQAPEENLLRVKAENTYASSYAVVGYDEGAGSGFTSGEDVQKLFSPYKYVPEVYALAGEIPADIRFISNKEETIVPLGIKTGVTGEMQLTFTGMDNYTKASKIEFMDALESKTIDLTGMQSYTYPYTNKEIGIQNGRFSLRVSNTMTDISDVNPDNLKIYGDSEGIYVISTSVDPVQNVTVYDFQGRKLYENASGTTFYPLQENFGHSPLIVKVTTKNQVKSVKLSAEK